jgi:hypothetical protein
LDDSSEKVKELKGETSHSICASCHEDVFKEFKDSRKKEEELKGLQGV